VGLNNQNKKLQTLAYYQRISVVDRIWHISLLCGPTQEATLSVASLRLAVRPVTVIFIFSKLERHRYF